DLFPFLPWTKQFPPRLSNHSVTQRARSASRNSERSHVKELDFRNRPANQLLDNLRCIGTLELIPVHLAHRRTRPCGGALVAFQLHVISAGFGMVLKPVMDGGTSDNIE